MLKSQIGLIRNMIERLRHWGQANLIAILWFSNPGRPIVARKPRVHFDGALYHVMSRDNQDQSIFKDDGDRERYLDVLKESRKRFCVTRSVISWS